MKSLGLLSWAFAAALTVGCSDRRNDTTDADRDSTVGTSGTSERVDAGDRDFVRDLTAAGAAEVKLGTLASERGSSADVKAFGQTIVKDHTAASERLKQIATQYNVDPGEARLDQEHTDLIDRLSQLKGAEFDREFIKAMVDGHEGVVDKLQARVDERDRLGVATGQTPKDVNVKPEAADNTFEASLNTWAADTLPVTKGHLERAKNLDEKLSRGRNTRASNP
jgi:putative membrane protein